MQTTAAEGTSAEPVGFIGLGAMGAPMARRLVSLGYQVLVHDLDTQAVQDLVRCGARAVASPREMASQARLVFTCLPSLQAIRQTVMAADGLQAGSCIRTYVDFSTTGSYFARELAAELRSRGIAMLDAPITGNVTTAGNGALGVMCSGAASAFEHARPVMADLANTTLLYLGEQNGKAQTLKLLNNLLSATGMAASCEAMILGVKAGLDPERMLEVINAGEASSSATRNKFPKSILPRRFDFGARMAITAKDISLTVGEAEDLGVPMWIGQAVRQIWKYAVSQGGAEKDGTSLITFLEPWAGVQVKAANVARSAAAEGSPQKIERPRFVIACESAVTDAVARQLAARGWDARGDNQGPRSCTIVAVTPGCTPAQFRAALPPASDGHCIVLNACLMRTDEAERIAQALAQEGHGYVDALLSGPARQVACGEATVLASGEAAFVDAAIPLLEALGKRVSRVGDMAGQAQLMHQITGSLAATLLAASCESFVTGAKAGLDPLTMTKILGIETGRNAASAHIIPEQVATRRFDHGKRIGESLRELSLLSEEASRRGVTTWILDRARLLYGLAAQMGSPEDDMTRLATYYERWAGTQVRTPLAPDAS